MTPLHIRHMVAGAIILSSLHASAAEVTRVGPFAFHSSFWISLHETLMHCATATRPCEVDSLTPDERAIWNEAVETYRTTGSGEITFRREMRITHDVLTQILDDDSGPKLRPPLGRTLVETAPIYRRYFWPADDAANRFWIGYASAMVRDAGDELAREHARVYALPWPKAVRVDAAPYAVPVGAYTMIGQLAGVHETVATRDSGNAGLTALEVVFHEASHALVHPVNGPVAEAIRKQADRLGIEPPRDLWHAILFATTSELTRRALRKRGISDYTPNAEELFTRAWPQFREPIQKYWVAYIDQRITFDEAIGKIVEAVPKPH
jgi:hypothetical protein